MADHRPNESTACEVGIAWAPDLGASEESRPSGTVPVRQFTVAASPGLEQSERFMNADDRVFVVVVG